MVPQRVEKTMRGVKTVLFMIALCVIATSAEARREYMIEEGDTPGELPEKFTPSLEELRRANPKINLRTLQVGDVIVDSRFEEGDVRDRDEQIKKLEQELAAITRDRDGLRAKLTVAEKGISEVTARIEVLEPLASQAETYRDRFWGVVSVLSLLLAVAVALFVWQTYRRGKTDQVTLNLQKENSVYRARLEAKGVTLDTHEKPKVKTKGAEPKPAEIKEGEAATPPANAETSDAKVATLASRRKS